MNRCIADVLPKICPNLNSKRMRGSRKLTFNLNASDIKDEILRLIDFNLSEMEMNECPKRNYGRFNPNFASNRNDTNRKVVLQVRRISFIINTLVPRSITSFTLIYGLFCCVAF